MRILVFVFERHTSALKDSGSYLSHILIDFYDYKSTFTACLQPASHCSIGFYTHLSLFNTHRNITLYFFHIRNEKTEVRNLPEVKNLVAEHGFESGSFKFRRLCSQPLLSYSLWNLLSGFQSVVPEPVSSITSTLEFIRNAKSQGPSPDLLNQ